MLTCMFPVAGLITVYCYLVYNCFNLQRRLIPLKELILIFAITAASFGYGLTPIGETDLTRYFKMLSNFEGMSFLDILKKDKTHLYTRDLLFYFVYKTGDVHLLPFITGFNIYGICGYILYDQTKRSKHRFTAEEFLILVTITFSIITPYSLIGNVRCVQAYIIISLGVYRELVEKKRDILSYILYVIAIGLHSSAFLLVAVRFLYRIFKRFRYIVLFLPLVMPFLIDLSYSFVDYYPFVIKSTVSKAHSYLHWTTGGFASEIGTYLSNKIIRAYGTFYLISILACLHLYKRWVKESLLNNPMICYLFSILILALSSLTIKLGVFWRLESVVVLFSPIYIVPMIASENVRLRKIIYGIFFSSVLMAGANLVYMMRNIVPIETFENMLSLNGFYVLYSFLKGFTLFLR